MHEHDVWLLTTECNTGLIHTEMKLIKCGFQLQDDNINLYWNFKSLTVIQTYYSKQGKMMFVFVCE